LPGTGKTTVLRASVRLFEEAKLTFALMAPTGIAAKRLSAVTGHSATTVHRALKYDGDSWGYHSNNRYVVDAVVLDEASMLDQELLFRLLSALRPETRIVFVGDDAQLPSVGPGNVLREMIECDEVPHVRLTEIFRQSVKGEIVTNSHRINSGKLPDLSTQNSDSEFRFVRCPDEDRIAELIVQMASKLKARDANFQVLSPKYDGAIGVTRLNERLRDVLNPEGPMEWVRGKTRFRKGDRLMVIQNDYELNVYNGDVGKLDTISNDGLLVKIHGVGDRIPDTMVPFKSEIAATKLRLAYCITAHKSQGSEFDTIIMPITRSQGRMLQRNLLYTAVTRARKRVWLIGEEIAVQKAVENNKVIRRNTIFSRAITAALKAGVQPEDALKVESGAEGKTPEAGVSDPIRQDHGVFLDRGPGLQRS
jgi:exodeoxyribonuclease V alpha subunit